MLTGTSKPSAIWYAPVSFVITNFALLITSINSSTEVFPKIFMYFAVFIFFVTSSTSFISELVPQNTTGNFVFT